MKHLLSFLTVPLFVCGIILSGCKSEPTLVSAPDAKAADETAVDTRTNITAVKSSRPATPKGNIGTAGERTKSPRNSSEQTTEPTILVFGKVTTPGGEPAKDVTIELHSSARFIFHASQVNLPAPVAVTQTDNDGRYEITAPTTPGIHLQVTGNVPGMMVNLGSDFYQRGTPRPGLFRIEKDITLLDSHRISGSIVDETGKPMAGLPVHVRPQPVENETRRMHHTETTSTAAGTFELDKLAPGPWLIGTVHPGYAAVTKVIEIPTTGPINLELGNRGGTITGYVRQKDSGSAAAGVPVILLPAGMESMRSLENYAATSALDGAFRFDNVSSGTKQIQLAFDGKPTLGLALPTPGPMGVQEKQTTEVVVFVYPGHTVSGRAYDKDTNEPLPGVEIVQSRQPADTADQIVTDSNGNYRIEHVFPTYSANVSLTPRLEGFALSVGEEMHTDRQSQTVNLTENNLNPTADFPMVQTIKIRGKVVTKDEMPIPHATVKAHNNRSFNNLFTPSSVKSDGTFEVQSLPFVSIVLEGEATGFGPVVSETIEITTKDIEGIKLVMEPGAAIHGRVLDPSGEPVPEAKVRQKKQYGIFGTTTEGAVSAKDGSFTMRDLAKEVSLVAGHEDYADSEELTVNLQPGETRTGVDIMLREGHSISGKVVDMAGKGVAKASVQAQQNMIFKHMSADEDGSFELKGLPEGTYSITASGRSGYKSVQGIKTGTTDLRLVLGERERSDDGPEVKFTGTVVDDATDDPIRDFDVEVNYPNIQFKKLPGPGKFELTGVLSGHGYSLKIKSPDYETHSFTTESSRNGGDIAQTFRLGRSGAITGRVVEKGSGTPMADVTVINWGTAESHERSRKGPVNHSSTDKDGKFVLAPAPSGENTVEVRAEAPYSVVSRKVTVKSEDIAEAGDIELPRGGTITGIVVKGSDEEPVPSKSVSLNGWANEMQINKRSSTDAEGKFEFTGLPAMNFTVQVDSNYKTVQLAEAATEDVKFILGGVTVRGTVTRSGTPVRASISATGSDQRFSSYAQTGEYELKNVMPGTYEFEVRSQEGGSYNNPLKETVEVPDQPEFVKDFVLPDGKIIVTVTDSAGQPVRSAAVSLSQKSSNSGYDQRWLARTMQSEQTDAEGKVGFNGLGGGVYSVSARKEGVGTAMKPDIQVSDNQTVEVPLQLSSEGGTLISTALSYATGQGVQEAWCYLHGEGGPFTHGAQRDATGLMVIENIPPGTYTTNVSYWSHSQSEKQIEIKANETVRIEDVLYPAGAINWTLSKANGSGAAGAMVTVTPIMTDPPEEPRSGQTDTNGMFVQRGLAAGTYQVTAQLLGKSAVTETFTVAAGAIDQKSTTVPGW